MKCIHCHINTALVKCCSLGVFCSAMCAKLNNGHGQHIESQHIYVVAPHTCVISPVKDPGCDKKTNEIAEKLHKAINNSILRKNNKPRREIDGNRAIAKNEPFRRGITEDASFIIEVHSFTYSSSFGGVDDIIEVVILKVNDRYGKEELFNNILGKDISVIKQGHRTTNSIGHLARQPHVLLEFRDSLSDKQIDRHITNIANYFNKTK